jgi:hypothetical protein
VLPLTSPMVAYFNDAPQELEKGDLKRTNMAKSRARSPIYRLSFQATR